MKDCPNLMDLFGDQYRVECDDSVSEMTAAATVHTDPALMQIPCNNAGAVVYPWDKDYLQIHVNKGGSVFSRLKELLGECEWSQEPERKKRKLTKRVGLFNDGDKEATFNFRVSQFGKVAEIVKPKKRG